MPRTTLWILAGALPLILAVQQAPPQPETATYSDPRYGFKLRAPQYPAAKTGETVTTVMMSAPAVNNFQANLNVVVERAQATREQYIAATRTQLGALGLKMLSEKNTTVSGRDAVLVEYQGQMGNLDLRWLALLVIDRDQVYVVTCTALAENYAKYEPLFRESLKTFTLTR